jgi:hypothetical protein
MSLPFQELYPFEIPSINNNRMSLPFQELYPFEIPSINSEFHAIHIFLCHLTELRPLIIILFEPFRVFDDPI